MVALNVAKVRLASSWEERERDSLAADTIVRCFESSWEEGMALRRSLLQDLHRKLDALFPVEALMARLESGAVLGATTDGVNSGDGGTLEEARAAKLLIWEELKIEIISRNLVATYGVTLLTLFTTLAMAIVGKTLYWWGLLKDTTGMTFTSEDIGAANRIFLCIAARFVQHGTLVLAESVRNAVRAIFGRVSLQEPTSRTLLESLYAQVRHEVETACGRSILTDCLFGQLEEMVSGDLTSARRRLFIGLVTETRILLRGERVRDVVQAQVGSEIEVAVREATGATGATPFLAVIPKLGKAFHRHFVMMSTTGPSDVFGEQLKGMAAKVFVAGEEASDVCNILVHTVRDNIVQ